MLHEKPAQCTLQITCTLYFVGCFWLCKAQDWRFEMRPRSPLYIFRTWSHLSIWERKRRTIWVKTKAKSLLLKACIFFGNSYRTSNYRTNLHFLSQSDFIAALFLHLRWLLQYDNEDMTSKTAEISQVRKTPSSASDIHCKPALQS